MKPKEGLSTPVVFRHLDYDQLALVEPTHLLEQFMEGGLAEAEYVNDLELPAFKAMPSLQKMKAELQVRTPERKPCCFYSVVAITWRTRGYVLILLKATRTSVPSKYSSYSWPVSYLVLSCFSDWQGLGFDHVLMSGSGSTIFCIGSPELPGPWTDEFAEKWGAMVIDTHFINRPIDDNVWYAEA